MAIEHYWDQALERSTAAQLNGALVPLSTELSRIPARQGEPFELRKLKGPPPSHLVARGPKQNPFLPWDPRLEVSQIGMRHVLILNKYPVQKGHMLLITREWAPQHGWLSCHDWEALLSVDQDTKGLWFFNSSPAAGASQPHRHLQFLRRSDDDRSCPRQEWFQSLLKASPKKSCPLTQCCAATARAQNHESEIHYQAYLTLCGQIGLGNPKENQHPRQPYNLLLTKEWIALILRSREGIAGFSINALGFAGYLLSTEISDLAWLNRNGPEALLEGVVKTIP